MRFFFLQKNKQKVAVCVHLQTQIPLWLHQKHNPAPKKLTRGAESRTKAGTVGRLI